MGINPVEKFRSASVPHIRFDIPEKTFSHFSIHTRVMQFGWQHSGKFALIFSLFLTTAVLIPYTIALSKGNKRPLLPLISHDSDSESENGLFSIALYITASVGVVMAGVRYVYVSSQNESKNWKLNVMNKLGLTSGIASFAGLIVVASFRVSIPQCDGEQLNTSRLIPHVIGAFFAFFFGALYLLLQTCLSLFYYEGNARIVITRFVIFLMCSVCFSVSVMCSVAQHKVPSSPDVYLPADIMAKPLKDTHALRSVFEWLLVFFFATYFLTFVKEGQKISVVITFRHLVTGRRISLSSLSNMSKI